mmetsp:Transcript_13993/g.22749  ORF Transcript_13993/g.22749 Transcript_13993/m.22749 type:complete len:243 (-) Transcript_13993:386-1114(-)
MDLRSIILQLLLHLLLRLPQRNLTPLPTPTLHPNHKPNLPTRITRYRTIRILHRIKQRLDRLHQWPYQIHMQPHTLSLRTNDPPLSQTPMHRIVKRSFEEHTRRPHGIARIGDNHIECRLILLHELCSVHNVDRDARVVEALGHEGEVLFGDGDDVRVQFANDDFGDGGVFGDFAEDSAVSAADDEDFLGVGVGVEGDVGHHFLVAAFIPFCALNDTIQHEHLPVIFRVENQYVLKLALLVI